MALFDVLKYGVIGLGLALAVLSYRLLSREQGERSPRHSILYATYLFMAFSLVMLSFGFFGLYSQVAPSTTGFHPRSLSDESFGGRWHVKGEDLDFSAADFIPRNNYEGDLDFSVNGGMLSFSGQLRTIRKADGIFKGAAQFTGQGPISDNQVAAYYDYANERVKGFGVIFLQFDYAGKEATGYCVFRVTTGQGSIGQAILRLSR